MAPQWPAIRWTCSCRPKVAALVEWARVVMAVTVAMVVRVTTADAIAQSPVAKIRLRCATLEARCSRSSAHGSFAAVAAANLPDKPRQRDANALLGAFATGA